MKSELKVESWKVKNLAIEDLMPSQVKNELVIEKWKTVSEKGGREEGISLKGHNRLIIGWPKEDQRDSEGWPKEENETTEGRRKKKT